MQCVLSQVNPSVCDSHRRLHTTVSRRSGICLQENRDTLLSSATRLLHGTARGFAAVMRTDLFFSCNIFILSKIVRNENENERDLAIFYCYYSCQQIRFVIRCDSIAVEMQKKKIRKCLEIKVIL